MKHLTYILLFLALSLQNAMADTIIDVSPVDGPDNQVLAAAIEKATAMKDREVTIRLKTGVYDMDYDHATQRVYHASNTTSERENATALKQIALLLNHCRNLTIDGQGSTLLLDGEMTTFVLDHCQNITLRRLNIDQRHPTQVEMEVTGEGADWLTLRMHPTSQYRITEDRKIEWYGKGWSFTEGIAQWYDRRTDKTWRGWCPTKKMIYAVEQRPGEVYVRYQQKPSVPVGTVFQVRDSYRDEVAALLLRSKNVKLEDVNLWFLGNFGVVGQFSENITIHRCNFEPRPGSGRTNAGYADFVQMSGCRGLIDIQQCRFTGAHDDPINIHGTHLKITGQPAANKLRVRFMHDQTFGFEAFAAGDDIQLTDAETLLSLGTNKLKAARMVDDYEMELTLQRPIDAAILKEKNVSVENVTWTPEVHIADCYFSRIPTRGVLLTTRRHSVIERCTFVGMQMASVFVCDDALGWYESGPVHDLTIRNNTFYRCGQPSILIAPESRKHAGAVHRGIRILDNTFCLDHADGLAVQARSIDGLTIEGNNVEVAGKTDRHIDQYFEIKDSENVKVKDNKVVHDAYQLK